MANILRVRTTLAGWTGGPGVSTDYWTPGTTGGSAADALDAVTRVRAFWLALAAQLPTGVTAQVQSTVDAVDALTGSLASTFSPAQPAIVTGSGGALAPPVDAAIITIETGTILNGVRFKGAKFISPLAAGVVAGGTVNGASITVLVNAQNGLRSGGTTASFPVVWHRPKGLAVGAVFAQSGATVQAKVGILRSRRDD